MKVLILLALVCAASAYSINPAVKARFNQELRAKFMEKLGVIGTKADLIPDLNATMPINDTKIEFNNTLILGAVELLESIADGLHTLVDDIDFNILTLKASGVVDIETVRVHGRYGADLIIHLPFVEPPFTNETIAVGAGAGDISAGKLHITFDANLIPNFITDRVIITNLHADLTVETLYFLLENLVVDGIPVNWDEVNHDAVAWLMHLLETQNEVIVHTILEIVNTILKEIPLSDIIGAVGK